MVRRASRLRLEQLEDRCLPSLTVTFLGGSLYISGRPTGELDITHVGAPAAPTFSVTDNSQSLGTYNLLNSLYLSLTSEPNDIKINLNGGQIPGNVTMSLGVGYTGPNAAGFFSVDLYDDSGATPTGHIGGGVTILGGNGQETYNLGNKQTNPAGLIVAEPIVVGGSVNVTAAQSNSFGPGDDLRIGDGTSVLGSVTANQVDQFSLGSAVPVTSPAHIGFDLSVNDYIANHNLVANLFGTVGRNVTVVGSALDDSFAMQDPEFGNILFPTQGGFVGGTLNVNLGQGQTLGDQLTLGQGTVVVGNATVAAGDNLNTLTGDRFNIFGSVYGNLAVNMGNGMNSLTFEPGNVGAPEPVVGGNMTVTAGNGTNVIGQVVTGVGLPPATGEFTGMIGGNLTFHLGNGDNGSAADPMIIAPVFAAGGPGGVGGNFNWTSGNGMDVLQLGDATTGPPLATMYNFNVNIHFGNNDDTFIMDLGDGGILSGLVDGGGRFTQNTFNQISGNLISSFTLLNFP